MAHKFDATQDIAQAAPLAVLEGSDAFLSAKPVSPSPAPVAAPSISAWGLK